ncbi:hypothetical protein F4803DRAFT_459770 [Xylaria telfairii]|nr:hypothetical protein F4803DRAFT_459770 [Xylaria telfairii]
MESPHDPRLRRPASAQRTTEYSIEPTSTSVEDRDGHERILQKHQAQPGGTTPAYLMKWTDTEIATTNIDNAVQLRSCIQDGGNSWRHVFVFHGLPVDYGVALKEVVDIDASFIEAHIGRRSYRSLKRIKAGWAHYDYPELVRRSSVLDYRRQEPAYRDLVADPPTFLTSDTGDSVVFCRASVWLSEKAHILFLDRAPWANSASRVSRRRYKAYTTEKMPDENGISTVTMQIDTNGNTTTLGNEIPDFETMLCDNLRDENFSQEDFLVLFEDLAINKWGDFFETLDNDLSITSTETATLFSQASGCLERNLDASRQRYKTRQRSPKTPPDAHTPAQLQPATAEWEALLSRLSRRIQLSRHLTKSAETDSAAGLGTLSVDGDHHCTYSKPRNNTYGTTGGADPVENENQRSLNRVAYLGGVLLPFSIVSGILAIEEPFGPGNAQFWVFWAVTAPLVLLTMAVIYADSIRKAEVWIEVAKPDVEELQALPPPVPGRLAEPVTLSLSDDVEGPDRIVEKRWRNSAAAALRSDARPGCEETHWEAKKRWRKEELGWMGAFATMFQLYKLKTGGPPEGLRRN